VCNLSDFVGGSAAALRERLGNPLHLPSARSNRVKLLRAAPSRHVEQNAIMMVAPALKSV
jgi:hypothetical protein